MGYDWWIKLGLTYLNRIEIINTIKRLKIIECSKERENLKTIIKALKRIIERIVKRKEGDIKRIIKRVSVGHKKSFGLFACH